MQSATTARSNSPSQNVLGYSANFDLLPDFKEYEGTYDQLNTTIGHFFDCGIKLLLAAASQDDVKAQLTLDQIALGGRASFISMDCDAAFAGFLASKLDQLSLE